MEEESENRRERLKAMRAVAAAAPPTGGYDGGGGLANPLLEESAPPQGGKPLGTSLSRFDFYTDPLALYSGHKKNAAATPSAPPGPMSSQMSPISSDQVLNNYSLGRGMHQAQGTYYRGVPYSSPRGFARPYFVHQGTPPGVWSGTGGTYSSPAVRRGMNSPYPIHHGNPNFSHGKHGANWGGGQNPSSGRGQGQWQGGGRGFGRGSGRGRGRGFDSHGSAADEMPGSEKFYNSSMFEDPWQNLQPVVWKGSGTPSSWLPNSTSMKKQRVSEPSKKSTSQPSLAEYLAATMNEFTNDSQSTSHD